MRNSTITAEMQRLVNELLRAGERAFGKFLRDLWLVNPESNGLQQKMQNAHPIISPAAAFSGDSKNVTCVSDQNEHAPEEMGKSPAKVPTPSAELQARIVANATMTQTPTCTPVGAAH